MEKSCCMADKSSLMADTWQGKVKTYFPLIVILAVSFFVAVVLSVQGSVPFMNALMGVFLMILSVLKLFDVRAFADSFARYDILAQHYRCYALAYPFIELAFACLYLSDVCPVLTNLAFAVVMAVGTVGVWRVVQSGAQFQCACVGTGFNLPVGRVTLAENVSMGAMAILNLIQWL